MGSEMHNFRVITKTHFKFWFGSPCINLSLWRMKKELFAKIHFLSEKYLSFCTTNVNFFPSLQDYPQLLWNGNTKTTQREPWQQLLQVSRKYCQRNILYWLCSYYMNISDILLLSILIRKKAQARICIWFPWFLLRLN